MTIVETPSSLRQRPRWRALVLSALTVFMTAAVALAVPAQQAYAYSLPPIGPVVLGAIGEAAVVVGEGAVAASAVTIGVGLIAVIGVGVAVWYLNQDHSVPDAHGPMVTGPLQQAIQGPQDGKAGTVPGYVTDYMTIPDGAWSDAHTFTRTVMCHEYDDSRETKYCPGPDWPQGAQTACLKTDGTGYMAGANGNGDAGADSSRGLKTFTNLCGSNMPIGVYYPPSNSGYTQANARYFPNQFSGPAGAADLVFQAISHCVPADGTPMFSVTKLGTFGQGALPVAQCPDGSTVSSVDYSASSAAVPGMDPQPMGTITNNTATMYPQCVNGCKLRVLVDGNPCRVGVADCYDWLNVSPSRVQCSYGTYTVGLADCDTLAYAYRSGNGLTFDPSSPNQRPVPAMSPTDPRPDTTRGPGTAAPGPTTTVQPAPTGTPSPTPTPTATPTPSGTGSPSATPSPTTVPAPGGSGAPGPGSTPDESNCFPSGWGMLNPVEWVLKPVKCALVWAFVPPAGTLTTAVQGTRDTLSSKPPYSLIAPVAAPLIALGHSYGGGCGGSFADFGGGLVIPCSPGGAGWAVTLYAIASVAIVVTTALGCWYMLETALHKE